MINKKNVTQNKFLLFFSFFTAFLFLGANFVSALTLEVPSLKVSCPDSGSCLPQYISSIFSWAISIAGVLSLISFLVGAVGLIISGDSTEASANAKDRMKGAVIGLALTLCSLLILTTINPVFKNPTLTPLPDAPTIALPIIPGVFYYTEAGCKGDSSGPNTSSQNHIDSAFAGK
ncbi:MAG: pilin, partial [Candidatus Parcubacteria bacterium]|nr:pilin [Candidatus Parcubacteria bacterium]